MVFVYISEMLLLLLKKFSVCRMWRLRAQDWRLHGPKALGSIDPGYFFVCINCQTHHGLLFDTLLLHPHDGMNTMYLSHLLLIYAEYVLRDIFIIPNNLHILRGSPCILAIKSSIFQLNVSFNCVVNIYQKGGDCKCHQALSGFW